MADLKAAYPDGVCVAVLAEVRNITNLQEVTQYQIGFNVDILSTATEGNVYQTIHTAAFLSLIHISTTLGSQPTVYRILSTVTLLFSL